MCSIEAKNIYDKYQAMQIAKKKKFEESLIWETFLDAATDAVEKGKEEFVFVFGEDQDMNKLLTDKLFSVYKRIWVAYGDDVYSCFARSPFEFRNKDNSLIKSVKLEFGELRCCDSPNCNVCSPTAQ